MEKMNKVGSIIDSRDMREKFKTVRNQDYFADKSNIINKFNNLINKDGSNKVCITKPRRFGKTTIASLLVTYYSRGIDSKKIFDEYKVSKGISFNELYNEYKVSKKDLIYYEIKKTKGIKSDEKVIDKKIEKEIEEEVEKELVKEVKKEIENEIKKYKEFQGKYHTLYFDFSESNFYDTLDEYLLSLNEDFKNDIKNLYPNAKILDNYNKNILKNIKNFCIETDEKFILIIDEWDYMITNNKFTQKEREKYIVFLKSLIKDKSYSAFVYMTGILPLAKELSQSTLNCFLEYSMLNDEKYYQYFGFTEQEVRCFCKNNDKYYEDLESWYNGYKAYNGEKIFNSWSVYQALNEKKKENYWTNTGRFDELMNVIKFNINGVKDDILELIKGNVISIELDSYGADEHQKENEMNDKLTKQKKNEKNDDMRTTLYSKMVTFGFLTYYNGKISIPNKELKQTFIKALKGDDQTEYYYTLIQNSNEMLRVTLEKNPEKFCELIENAHLEKIKSGDKMDHGNLKRVIEFAYFHVRVDYDIDEEVRNGKGIIDFIFYPKKQDKTIIILELKLDASAKDAIKQIQEKKYFHNLIKKGYTGNIIAVGINLNRCRKIYSCVIEEYDRYLQRLSHDEYIPPKSEKRKKSDLKFDGIFKRLRSDDKNEK